jgi:hypothetical protein
VIPLAFIEVAIALLVVVALGEVVILLILLVSPSCHHVTQLHGSSRAIAPDVVVRVLREEPVLEAADDILVGDVSDGGTCFTGCRTSGCHSSLASLGIDRGECPS